MLTGEDNDLLTRVGPATPCGELMRRYWQPAGLSEELPVGGAPLPVRLLGEDLVLFRDGEGRAGLLGLHCSHRGADLSYGRVEDGGLRCIYHGWLYDIRGNCLDQPGEPGGGEHKGAIRHLAYPCQEVAGVIFAYMGPGEPPLLPTYKTLTVPEEYRFSPTKCFHGCSYLQANEGNLDPVHLSFLHRLQGDTGSSGTSRIAPSSIFTARDLKPTIEAEQTDFGLRIYAVRKAGEGQTYVRITNFVMPNLCAIAGGTGGDGYQIDWHVPIDDTHHWKYTMAFRASAPLGDKARARQDLTADYRLRRNAGNRYLQDREEMKTGSFSGLGTNFLAHDVFAVESQGPIQDRPREHLGSTDKGIVMGRLMLLRAIRDVQAGRDPLHVIRDPAANWFPDLVVKSEVIPGSTDWRSYWRENLG